MTATIALFFAALIALVIVGGLYPRSRVAQVVNLWYGPIPNEGEHKSQLLFRWAWHGSKWVVAFAIALAVVAYVVPPLLGLKDPTEHQLVFAFFFAFPLLLGTAILGTLLCLLGGAWRRFTGRDPTFDAQANDFVDNT